MANTSFLYAADLLGTVVFAFSGAITAGRKGMDLLGMTCIGTITAVGGGTLRDMLFGSGPVFWLKSPEYLVLCILTVFCTFLVYPTVESRFGWKDSAVAVCTADAFGLAAFSVVGAQKAANMGFDPVIWPVASLITCTFGGATRDVICLQNPRVMYPHRTLYGAPPLAGGIIYTLLLQEKLFGRHEVPVVAACACFMVTFTFRVLSFNKSWRLPHWKPTEDLSLFGDKKMKTTMTVEDDIEDPQQYTPLTKSIESKE